MIKAFKTAVVVMVIMATVVLVGCNGGDGGASDWAKPTPVVVVSNLRGQILPPVAGSLNLLPDFAYSLLSVDGTQVYIEEKPEFKTTVASSGSFLITNLPVGKYHVIAHVLVGTTSYRQRSDLIDLSGKFATQELTAPMPLAVAPYRVKLAISDLLSGSAVAGARLRVWGMEYPVAANGEVEVGPLPRGFWPISVFTAGYQNAVLNVGFQPERQAKLQIKLTPLTATDKNRAPLVEIEQAFKSIKADESVNLYAAGFDPDGDSISYGWQASRGSFLQDVGSSVVYKAPASSGSVDITVTAKDSKNAAANAVLRFDVLPGSTVPINPSNRAPLAATIPFPDNMGQNLGTEIVLRWVGKDPDNDPLTYDVFLATQGADLRLVGQNLAQPSFKVSNLRANQVYFWQVISRDVYEAISANNSVWQFTTGDGNNSAPYQAANPVPDDLAFDQLPSLRFTWTGGDPDQDDVVTYSFLLGLDQQSLEHQGTTRSTSFEIEDLELGKTYYWQIIAADNRGKESYGPLWSFSTYAPPNQQPTDPQLVSPASGAINVPVDAQIRWMATDPDGDKVSFDVFVGSEFPLHKVAEDQAGQSYYPAEKYNHLTRYYWQVVVKDSRGLTNANSPIWSFTTGDKINQLPNVPQALTPANQAPKVALKPVFSWLGGDPDGDTVYYDLYLDTAMLPVVLVAENITATRWQPINELADGTKYYWQIKASDSSGGKRVSEILSFTTGSGADAEAPTIVSVTPAAGAINVSQTAEVVVAFSEPIDQASAITAFSFVPPVQGSWSWENDATARFLPSSPWLPGSYNNLRIAASVKDLAGNTLVTAGSYLFTVTATLPVPAGFRSSGFPFTANNNASVTINVPGIRAGGKSYALVVASPNQTTVSVRGSMREEPAPVLDAASAFRELEKKVAGHEFPAVMKGTGLRASIKVEAAPQINVSESFFIPAYGSVATTTAFPNNVIQATCLGLTDKTAIFVDNAITTPSNALMAEVRKRFEEVIQPRIRDFYGNEPPVGPDGDSRLTILITDSMATEIAGIFYGVDLFARNANDVQLRESNARKIFYLKYSLTSDIVRYGTMAHEFQHMVNYWQKRTLGGSNLYEDTWLNEGLSKFAEEVCGYGILEGDDNTARLIRLSQQKFADLSLTGWTGMDSYGLSYLFVRFIAQENRYGTTYRDITRKLVNSSLVGTANVEAVTGESFATTMARWGASLYLNRHTSTDPQGYGLKGLNLAGSYSGISLPGFKPVTAPVSGSINLSANQLQCFEKNSTAAPTTDLEFSVSPASIKIWTWDERP